MSNIKYRDELKIKYFKDRINDSSLTKGQRSYALFKYKQLKNNSFRIVKISDSKLLGSENKGSHLYLVGEKKGNGYRVNELTHLYQYDEKRKDQLNNNIYKEVKFKFLYLPSGVHSGSMSKKYDESLICEEDFESPGKKITYREYVELKKKGIYK